MDYPSIPRSGVIIYPNNFPSQELLLGCFIAVTCPYLHPIGKERRFLTLFASRFRLICVREQFMLGFNNFLFVFTLEFFAAIPGFLTFGSIELMSRDFSEELLELCPFISAFTWVS